MCKSTLGAFSAFGSFDANEANGGGDQYTNDDEYNAGGNRSLRGLSTVSSSSVAHGAGMFFRVVLVLFGIVLALSIHFFKMLVRLLGEGCLTQCITVLEITVVCVSVLVSIFVRQFAIFSASCLILAAGYNAKRRYEKRQAEERRQELIAEHQRSDEPVNNEEAGNVTTPPATEYAKMDEADAFLSMFKWKR